MNRYSPNLVYLTIYNPTLRSINTSTDDDEDAEEQAHILFYTSKERAVSRDKILRQIGLAKALVSFAEMFNGESPLDTVHSQTRRMVMISPEPNFWIHACVELAKTPRVMQDKGKSKTKDRNKSKGKEKQVREGPVYDYEDASVQDTVLKVEIMRAYERFKLTHGSFTAILNNIGQDALALQLERFWTPWAWAWSIEDGHDFGHHLGVAIHPYFKPLLPLIHDLLQDLPPDKFIPLLLSRSNIIPPTPFLEHDYPISLSLYLMSLIPPTPDPSGEGGDRLTSSQITIKGTDKPKDKLNNQGGINASGDIGGFMTDMKNWMLNFGKNPSSASSSAGNTGVPPSLHPGSIVEAARIDQNALDDAISSYVSPTPSVKEVDGISEEMRGGSGSVEEDALDSKWRGGDEGEDGEGEDERRTIQGAETPKAPPVFLRRSVYLPCEEDSLATSLRKVNFLLKGQWMLALIENESEPEEDELKDHLCSVASRAEDFFEKIEDTLQEETLKSDSIPSASKILQPIDVHITSTGKYTFGNKRFESKSGSLYEAKGLQEKDPDILEVFSRGQNPQHWHMARRSRVQPPNESSGAREPAEVYMQVFRKETSLADVDNVMTGVAKNWKAVVQDMDGFL
ncbi:hypothetical protein AGABI1DRAFT_35666 [Agaricus bisporus var. burnettii JB137-S8]|uniref:CCZ1/INTU/HSP4 first Longin domain-containing protein n=1 Tax=Agaricus bisporus var. burnettii (strain JB137-S8 / ATCC MYA-4627 / FGSC 10392) TaxID=597362 RepID=K5XEC4_AGABU|nr:uncharacterized protein AGABI1DRAFT_35666 [Agaricus bisporus var. burnettii JB137-S8]EKM81708.1 hypothetical protein AGABI1DRAFT_35666 [Agaricus bisporus var. burnettii JB137-S8]